MPWSTHPTAALAWGHPSCCPRGAGTQVRAGTRTGPCAPRRVAQGAPVPCQALPGSASLPTVPLSRPPRAPCEHTPEGQWQTRPWMSLLSLAGGTGEVPSRVTHRSITPRKGCVSSQKRGCPPACSRHLRATKRHLQPFRELGQEQETSASSFQTPANTQHTQDDQKQI